MTREPEDKLIERIEGQLDAGQAASALDLSAYAVRRYPVEPDLWALYAESLESVGRIAEATKAYSRAVELSPDWTAGLARRASLLIEQGRIEEAAKDVDAVLEHDPEIAEAQFNRAVLAELEGNEVEAARAYRTAEMLDPGRYYLPKRVPTGRFLAAIEEARLLLPTKLKDYLAGVPVRLEDMPRRTPEGRWEAGENPLVFGYVAGPPIAKSKDDEHNSAAWAVRPLEIVVFKRNLERIAPNRGDLVDELCVTLYHEALFYLGVPEDDVAEPLPDEQP